MFTYRLKRGDLIRQKFTQDVAIITGDPFTKFVPDDAFYSHGVESGSAELFYPVVLVSASSTTPMVDRKWLVGFKTSIRHNAMIRLWEPMIQTKENQ